MFFFLRKITDANRAARSRELEPIALEGRGKLHSFATVHLHQDRSGKGLQAPFTVGLIVLDDGPAVRAMLTERTDAGLNIGDPMRSVLAPAGTNDEGKRHVELRFEKSEWRDEKNFPRNASGVRGRHRPAQISAPERHPFVTLGLTAVREALATPVSNAAPSSPHTPAPR